MVRQSGVLAHRKKCLFCKVTPVSIQAFVEGLLRLANVLEATHGTLKNVNNICTLAINSAKYFVLFSGDLIYISMCLCLCCRWPSQEIKKGIINRLQPATFLWLSKSRTNILSPSVVVIYVFGSLKIDKGVIGTLVLSYVVDHYSSILY